MSGEVNEELSILIDKAVGGNKAALETVLSSVQDLVFNLSLRMLGSFQDAQDATQDILLKIITHLSSFKKESAFSTWVFRVAVNDLINYKKHMFAQVPLSFDYYAQDIENGGGPDIPDLTGDMDQSILAEELKLSCTNVMLQCLDPESRCVFILGTMFKVDSRIAGDVLGISPEAYRQRLSRIRKKVAEFLSAYCGEYGEGKCRCSSRLNYAIQSHRLDPNALHYTGAEERPLKAMLKFKQAMEEIDDISQRFTFCKTYRSPAGARAFIQKFLDSTALSTIVNA